MAARSGGMLSTSRVPPSDDKKRPPVNQISLTSSSSSSSRRPSAPPSKPPPSSHPPPHQPPSRTPPPAGAENPHPLPKPEESKGEANETAEKGEASKGEVKAENATPAKPDGVGVGKKAPPAKTVMVPSRYMKPAPRPTMGVPPAKPSLKPPPQTPTLTIPLTSSRSKTPEKTDASSAPRNAKTPTKQPIVSTPRPHLTSTTAPPRPAVTPSKKPLPSSTPSATPSATPSTTPGRHLPPSTTIRKPPALLSQTRPPAKEAPTIKPPPAKSVDPVVQEKDEVIQQLNNKIAELQNQLKTTSHERDQLHSQVVGEATATASEGSEASNWDELSMGSNSENSSEIGDERDEKYHELIKRYRSTLSILLQKISVFKNALNEAKSEYDALRLQHNQLLASQQITEIDKTHTNTDSSISVS